LRISIKKAALLGSLPFLVFYVLIAGSPLTAVRAAAMALLAAGALLLNRPYALWNALAVTALLILSSDSAALFSCSFWLSFTAVAGLLAVRPWWQAFHYDRPASFKNQIIQFYGRLFIISLSALLVTMPLTALFFNQVTPLGIQAGPSTSSLTPLIKNGLVERQS